MTVSDIIKQIVPDFPEDRTVKGVQDSMVWYKWYKSTRTLLVPPLNYLKCNVYELDRFAEAIQAFAKANLEDSKYDWDNLELHEATSLDIVDALADMRELAVKYGGYVACDIETRRVEYEDNRVLSIGFAYDQDKCLAIYNIPISGARYEGPAVSEEDSKRVFDALEATLNDKRLHYIWQNGKFDCTRLKYLCNVDAHVDEDTILQHFACVNEKQGTHGLKQMGQLYLQAPAWDDKLDNIKRDWCRQHKVPLKEFMYDSIPTATLIPYMQRDCIATYRLHFLFNTLARPNSLFIYHQLCRASTAYGAIELAGQQIDVDYLEDLEAQLDKIVSTAQAKLNKVSGKFWDPLQYAVDTGAKATASTEFKPSSPKQLKWMLTKVMGHDVPSTNAVTMQNLMDELDYDNRGGDAREFMEDILEVRKYSKYLETYVLGIRDVLCRDNRVRCTFNLNGTETGRLSSSNPRHVGA